MRAVKNNLPTPSEKMPNHGMPVDGLASGLVGP